MNQTTLSLPASKTIRERMQACRDELAALKRLLRAAEAAEEADQASRRRREMESASPAEAGHV
jgi:hypothetical protein